MYGDVPPVTVKLTAPVEAPLQRTFVTTVEAEIANGSVIVVVAVVVQLFASFTVTV